ncbi:AAA family ATPase [Arcicella sp. LKC2W]|uniref:AAA family ATPase n=1 Tax=Arcicella sp. LKC2W TaxID=2984198 RepID=UPI002B2169D1|nr:AAA family ATPase [Arcicella sp. LKC2W]MEA5460143.1 AAA family ATPase [Arcicella sp. LKC2W]
MIKKITVQNFFSFGEEQTIELNADTNILVGINGTGKSNFIKLILLLQQGIKGEFEKLFSHKWGGFSGCTNFIHPDSNEIIISYCFDKLGIDKATKKKWSSNSDIFYDVRIKKIGLTDYVISEEVFNETSKIIIKYSHDNNPKELPIIFLSELSNPKLYSIKKAIEKISIYDYFDTSFGGEIRQLSPYYSEDKLLSNGKNLTALMSYFSNSSIKVYDKIIEELKNVNTNFKELSFISYPGKTLLSLKEKNLDRAITIEQISDGTLRYLLLLSIFYNPNRGSVVCIDEPEAGLHPDMINGIARGIKYAAQNGTQMIIATHSPLLLNAFELEDLMIFEKDEDNQTVVKTVSEEDFPDWEGEFLTGQMWLRGELGGVRW